MRIRHALLAMSHEAIRAKSRLACEAVIALPQFQRAQVVMIYLETHGEVATELIAQAAFAAGKTVLAPMVDTAAHRLHAGELKCFEQTISHGPYGIREPSPCPPWPAERIDVIVVPAIAYDRRCNRLGRGGGYYDRFLSDPTFRAFKCGLAFHEQILDALPALSHDIPVHMVATDQELIRR